MAAGSGALVPLNLPNVLTLSRIAFVPLLVMLLLGEEAGPLPAAAAVFGAAALTDAADGHIARSRDMITTFGRRASSSTRSPAKGPGINDRFLAGLQTLNIDPKTCCVLRSSLI